jgi:hypothetical protein
VVGCGWRGNARVWRHGMLTKLTVRNVKRPEDAEIEVPDGL